MKKLVIVTLFCVAMWGNNQAHAQQDTSTRKTQKMPKKHKKMKSDSTRSDSTQHLSPPSKS